MRVLSFDCDGIRYYFSGTFRVLATDKKAFVIQGEERFEFPMTTALRMALDKWADL